VTPISVDKETNDLTVDYHVTYKITNSGNHSEESIKIVFTMDPDNPYETLGGIKNESFDIEKLNSSETKNVIINFTRIIGLDTLKLKNFYGNVERREVFCIEPS
jgi:hypothetical protein